jgi:hypothetical protein
MADAPAATSTGTGVDAAAVLRGAAAGAAAFAAAYVVAFVLWQTFDVPNPRTIDGTFRLVILADLRGGAPAWKAAGHVLLNAQFVDSSHPAAGSINLVHTARNSLLALAYGAPPLALAAAGSAAAVRAPIASIGRAGAAGALVVVGYLPIVVAGAVVFSIAAPSAFLEVPVVTAVVLAGVVYPVVFGALGGTIAGFA